MKIKQRLLLSLVDLRPSVRPHRRWPHWLSISLGLWCAAASAAPITVPAEPSAEQAAAITRRVGFVANGSQAFDRSGYSVSNAGDVNGDGLADVIIGARGADPSGRSYAGRSYVVFGKRNIQPVALSNIEQGTSQAGFVINGSQASDNSGGAVSNAGDVNGDGLADVLVGAFGADPSGGNRAGRSYVVLGKRDTQPVALSSIENDTSQAGFVINGSNIGDVSGYSVSNAGDVNGDGLADVLVGAYLASPSGRIAAGRSYVVFGKRDTQPVALSSIEHGTSQAGVVINGSKGGDFSGRSVSNAGDVNGDGLADVLVGANGADPSGRSFAGRSYVVFGKRNIQPVELSSIENGTSQAGIVINGSNTSDLSGYSVSGGGDVNGDGLADVIVGALGADPSGGASAGRSYVVFGKRNTQPVELSGKGHHN